MYLGGINVALVQLYSELQPPNAEPFAVEVLASAITRQVDGCTVAVHAWIWEPHSRAEYQRQVRELAASCDILGISAPQGTHAILMEVLEELDAVSDRPLVILGHALPTHNSGVYLRKFPWCVTAQGWGEDALIAAVELVKHGELNLERIPGVTFATGSTLVSTPIKLVSAPQVPFRVAPDRYFARVESSRGCHYGRCTFCTRPPGPRDRWDRFPIDTVISTINDLKSSGVTYFTFTDEDFIGNDVEGALEIARRIAMVGGMRFSLSTRGDNLVSGSGSRKEQRIKDHLLRELVRAGLDWVFIGLESLSRSQLRRFGKGSDPSTSVRAVRALRRLGVRVETGFMLFDPLVTLEELDENARALRKTGIWRYASNMFSEMRVQSDAPFARLLQVKGLLNSLDSNSLTYEWDFQDSRSAQAFAICCEWLGPFHSVLRAARNTERTLPDLGSVTTFLHRVRRLDLEFLHAVVAEGLHDGVRSPLQAGKFAVRRASIVENFHSSVTSHESRGSSLAEDHLRSELRRFLSQ